MLTIDGGTLAGMACAARLAKLGHPVTLHTDGPLGERWAAQGTGLPPVLTLPATWRDLFKKSGRTLDAELARAGLDLVEAPPAIHRFADGSELALPDERGQQFAALSERYGRGVAEAWRDLLDELDEVWMAARRFGVERPDPPTTTSARRRLWLDRTLADVADRAGHPHLAQVVLGLGPAAGTRSPKAPGLLASRLSVARMFGRWHLTDGTAAAPATRLLGLVEERLATRKVHLAQGRAADPAIDCLPRKRWNARASLAPHRATARVDPRDGERSVSEVVDHTGSAPVIAWRCPTPDGVEELTWDFTRAGRDQSWGQEPRSARAVVNRPPVLGERPSASACSPAGPEPWAELASAALAVYELHERLTGEDSRPTNRNR